jgi:hypothetical protein
VSAKASKAVTAVSRSRAAQPARNSMAVATGQPSNQNVRIPETKSVKPARPVTHTPPIMLRHEAPPRPALVAPARSMPTPVRDVTRRPMPAQPPRPVMPLPDFAEAGVLLAITYSIREGRRNEFFELMRELKPLLSAIGGTDCTVYEDRSRGNYFMEVFRFKDEAEFTAFDDKFHKDRKIAAIYTLLDDIVEAEKSDFKIFERRL